MHQQQNLKNPPPLSKPATTTETSIEKIERLARNAAIDIVRRLTETIEPFSAAWVFGIVNDFTPEEEEDTTGETKT